jgi:hypothetical protein
MSEARKYKRKLEENERFCADEIQFRSFKDLYSYMKVRNIYDLKQWCLDGLSRENDTVCLNEHHPQKMYNNLLKISDLLPKRKRIDTTLRNNLNFLKCLPSQISQNQFFSALIEDVICNAQLLYDKRKNIYSLVEDLFLLSYESRYFSIIHYQHKTLL